jgi:hypothetical protein
MIQVCVCVFFFFSFSFFIGVMLQYIDCRDIYWQLGFGSFMSMNNFSNKEYPSISSECLNFSVCRHATCIFTLWDGFLAVAFALGNTLHATYHTNGRAVI